MTASLPTIQPGEPPALPAGLAGSEWLAVALTTAVAMAVYVATLAPEVTLGDAGILATAASYAGVGSNPGHPVWTLYAWFWAQLPFGNVAARVAFGDAVASALASGLLAWVVARTGRFVLRQQTAFARLASRERNPVRIAAAVVAGLAFAFSPPVWRPAVVVETWAMTHLLAAATLALLARWALTPARRGWLLAATFSYGLLLTNAQHLLVLAPALAAVVILAEPRVGRDFALPFLAATGLLMAPSQFSLYEFVAEEWNEGLLMAFLLPLVGVLVLIVKTRAFGTHGKLALLGVMAVFCGLLFALYPVPASMSNPPVNWGYPRDPEGFRHIFMRGQFERVVPVRSLALFLDQLRGHLLAAAPQFGWQYVPFVFTPLAGVSRLSRAGRRWLLATALVWLCAGPLLLTQLNPPANPSAMALAMQHFGVAFLPPALLVGWGLMLAGGWAVRQAGQAWRPTPSSSLLA